MKLKTRIGVYHNISGKLYYRPQWKLPLLPIWFTFTGSDGMCWWTEEFLDIRGVVNYFKERDELIERNLNKKRYHLKSVSMPHESINTNEKE